MFKCITNYIANLATTAESLSKLQQANQLISSSESTNK